jgi:hypothetical protein
MESCNGGKKNHDLCLQSNSQNKEMTMKTLVFLVLAAALAGCATPAERAAQMQHKIDEMIQVYGPSCVKLGYKADTDQWRDCILRLDARDTYRYGRDTPTMTNCFGDGGFIQCTTF